MSAEPATAAPRDPHDGSGRGLFAIWAAIAGGWAGLFTPFAAAGIVTEMTTPAAVAAEQARLGYGFAFQLEVGACLLAVAGVVGCPVGIAGAFAATVLENRRGADWPPVRTALIGGYLGGLVAAAGIAGLLAARGLLG